MNGTICPEKGECFGKIRLIENGHCRVLNNASEYGSGTCPFQKPESAVTNGVVYPYNRHYGK